MSSSEEKISKRKLSTSYISTVVSIALVLFMLGGVGMLLLYAHKLENYVKEHIGFSVIIKDNVKEVDVYKLKKTLDAAPFVKSTEYIDKDSAAAVLQRELGEDFISFLGYNPLLASVDIRLNAAYANPDSIAWIEQDLMRNPKIKEVFYQKSLVEAVNSNVEKIAMVLLASSLLLLIIAIALINNSIRLAIYAKRFLIKSMQLVGATQAFIRRPFVWQGIIHGIYGALVAIGLLVLVIYWLQEQLPELVELQDVELFASLFGVVALLGILISWISTAMAVNKYLRMRSERLY